MDDVQLANAVGWVVCCGIGSVAGGVAISLVVLFIIDIAARYRRWRDFPRARVRR